MTITLPINITLNRLKSCKNKGLPNESPFQRNVTLTYAKPNFITEESHQTD